MHQKITKQLLVGLLLILSAAWASDGGLEQLREQALGGDPWAQLNLGAANDRGLMGLESDPRQAVYWYRRAAQQNIAEAQFNLAHCLATGHGVKQDYAESRVWMEKAAAQGLADAQFLLGIMLAEGLGGSADPRAADIWLGRAAAQGQQDAIEYLIRR